MDHQQNLDSPRPAVQSLARGRAFTRSLFAALCDVVAHNAEYEVVD